MKNDQEEYKAEFKDYLDAGFEPVMTRDGSISLRPVGESEDMHSSSGALSESFYVYYEALELFFKQEGLNEDFVVESVGLGLGYNEVLTVLCTLEQKNDILKSLKILSYESEKSLEILFLKRLREPEKFPFYWSQFQKHISFDAKKLCEELIEKLVFKGALTKTLIKDYPKAQKIILFDAYSNKTTESLWEEDFLFNYLSTCKEQSIISTYAATGVLNRVLKQQGFKNLKKPGFLKKRESTLAVKQ